MSNDSALLVQLLVRIAVIASMASIVLRWSFAKRLFLRERRTFRQRLELGLVFGAVFAAGTGVRLVLGYDAAEVGLEGAFVSGLVGGYLPGAVAGSLIALPAFLAPHQEWLALPLLAGVGALGGLLRDFAPGPEEIWRFSPFFPFTIPGWLVAHVRQRRDTDAGTNLFSFQMVLFFTCLAIEFIRTSLGHTFAARDLLFVLYTPQETPDLLHPVTIVLVYYSTVACVGLTLKVWNNTRIEWKLEEQQRLLMQARLDALTSQINPHFLFNTLNSVASLIRIDQETARQLIFKLSTILRRLLRKQEAFTPLREELAFIDDYLSIEVVRFGEKLRIVKEIDPQTLGALVPSMLLQPIVENSIKHGLSPKIDGGTIWLRSALRGGRLQLELEDDGVGIAPEAMPDIFQRGIGVSNVHERLRVLFGNEFLMVIHHRPGGGTQVRIQIPELQDPAAAMSPEERSAAHNAQAIPPQTVAAGRRD
jgi:two-component system LytT family sensor kinase